MCVYSIHEYMYICMYTADMWVYQMYQNTLMILLNIVCVIVCNFYYEQLTA